MHPTRIVLTLLLAALTATAALPSGTSSMPNGTSSSDSFRFDTPNEGMEVTLFDGADGQRLRFEDASQGLVGYLEDRRVYTLQFVESEDGQPERLVFDARTGAWVGYRSDFVQTWPFLVGSQDVVRDEHHDQENGGIDIGVWSALPESVLWGRNVHPSTSWRVPGWSTYCERSASVAVDEDRLVTVVSRCDLGDRVLVDHWTLDFGDGTGPFATERILTRSVIVNGTTVSEPPEERPVVVHDEGSYRLWFSGQSHVPIVDGRDRTYRYGALEQLPFDPEPHPHFDVRSMAGFAFERPLPQVRTFLAGADDFWLSYAASYEVQEGTRDWLLVFQDENARNLGVYLRVATAPAGGLVVVEEGGTLSSSRIEGRPGAVLAAPGDLVRAAELLVEDRLEKPVGWSWFASPQGSMFAAHYDAPLCGENARQRVLLDLLSGVVIGSKTASRAVGTDVQAVPRGGDCEHLQYFAPAA